MNWTSNDDFFLGLMDVRKQSLNQMYEVYVKYKVDYIGYSDELGQYFLYSTSDDPGIYSIVSHIGYWLNAKDIFPVYQGFMFFSIFLATCVALFGLNKIFQSRPGNNWFKWMSIFIVSLLGLFVCIKSDVYAFYYVGLCMVPLLYYSFTTADSPQYGLIVGSLFIMNIAEYCRSQSGLIAMLFLFLGVLILSKYSASKKALIVVLVALSFYAFKKYVKYKSQGAIEWLTVHEKKFDLNENTHHPYWHSIYIGLGFVKNNYGIEYRDSVAIDEVAKVNKTCLYGSDEYESIIRNRYMELLKDDPIFFIQSYGAKGGIILAMVLFLTLPVWGYRIFVWRETAVFGIAASYASLSALLVYPRINYLMPVIVLCVFYSIITIATFNNAKMKRYK